MAINPYSLFGAQQKRVLPAQQKRSGGRPGAYDPANAMSDIARLEQGYLNLAMAPAPTVDYGPLRTTANTQAQQGYDRQAAWTKDQQAQMGAYRKVGSEAATNFAAAMASILQGGQTGEAGQASALQNFGGSYLGGIAARMGEQLIAQQGHTFDAQFMELANKLADAWDRMPDEADKVYGDLVDQAQQGVNLFEANRKTKLAAVAAFIGMRRDDQKGLLAATKALGGGTPAAKAPYPIQGPGGAVDVWDPNAQTLTSLRPGKAPTVKTDVNVYTDKQGRSVPKGYQYDKQGRLVSIGTAKTGGKGKLSPSTISTTVDRATKAGEAVLGKITDNIWAKMMGAGAEQGTPEYSSAEAAYNEFLDSGKSFGTAMYKVRMAIAPHLRAIGYTPKQIRQIAYQIVSAEVSPPKTKAR